MADYLIRVQLPDRPGALGAVASRIGSVGGDVVSIEILERGIGVVVDELGVGLEDGHLIELVREEILEVDGVVIESVRAVDGLPDRQTELLELATDLFKQDTTSGLLGHLVERVRRSLTASFVAVLDTDAWEVKASIGDLPDTARLRTSALQAVAPPPDAGARDGEVATAVLVSAELVLVVGRPVPALRDRERQRIAIMAELADHGWHGLG